MSDTARTEEWYRHYGEAVFRRCQRLLGDDAQAWDFTQEVFLKAHAHAAGLKKAPSALAWLLTIADRSCLSALRRRRVEARVLEAVRLPGGGLEGDVALERTLLEADLVAHLLAGCPEEVQQVVVHRFMDELENEQIAALLSVSTKTVTRRLQAFYARARALLEGHEPVAAAGRVSV